MHFDTIENINDVIVQDLWIEVSSSSGQRSVRGNFIKLYNL